MFKNILIKLIIYLGLRKEQKFLRLLAKLEYGVGIFCEKLSTQASEENHHNLSSLLQSHAQQEIKHGKMLAALADGKLRLSRTENAGRWVSLMKNGEDIGRPNPDPNAQGCEISWDSVRFPGQTFTGVFENFDGLSKRYFSLFLLFGGRKADSFEWQDKLAFMYALECGTAEFYQVLKDATQNESLKAIASTISTDEYQHGSYLLYALGHFSSFPFAQTEKWTSRLNWCMWGLVVDVWRVGLGH